MLTLYEEFGWLYSSCDYAFWCTQTFRFIMRIGAILLNLYGSFLEDSSPQKS